MILNVKEGIETYNTTDPTSMNVSRCRRRLLQPQHVSKDIWFEVLSRLPSKCILICQCVCKAWYVIGSYLFIQKKATFLPFHGLLFKTSLYTRNPNNGNNNGNEGGFYVRGIHATSKEISVRAVSPDNLIVSSSGDDDDLVGELTLDFSTLYVESPSKNDKHGLFFSIHKGLLLIVDGNGSYQVHNPATKEVFVLPRPSIDVRRRRYDAIINLSRPSSSYRVCHFMVVRFKQRKVEAYFSRTHKWHSYRLSQEDRLLKAPWFLVNFVFLHETKSMYFLTNKNYGVVVKFSSFNESEICAYGFDMPEVVSNGTKGVMLGESEGCLYLSYFDGNGVWMWKHTNTGGGLTVDAWVPLFEISKTGILCKPVAMKHLVQVVNADTLDKIVEFVDGDYMAPCRAIPFSPCLASLEALKHYQEKPKRVHVRRLWKKKLIRALVEEGISDLV